VIDEEEQEKISARIFFERELDKGQRGKREKRKTEREREREREREEEETYKTANGLNHYDRVYSRKASRNTCRDTAH